MIYDIWYTALNPFHSTGLFLYTLKTPENLWFSDIFRGYRKRLETWNGLNTQSLETRFTGEMFRGWFCGGQIILIKKVTLQNLALTGEPVPTTRGNFAPTWDNLWVVNPVSANPEFDHFVGLTLKGITKYLNKSIYERFFNFSCTEK